MSLLGAVMPTVSLGAGAVLRHHGGKTRKGGGIIKEKKIKANQRDYRMTPAFETNQGAEAHLAGAFRPILSFDRPSSYCIMLTARVAVLFHVLPIIRLSGLSPSVAPC